MSTDSDPNPRTFETPVDKLSDFVAGLYETVTTQGSRAIDSLKLRTVGRPWVPGVDLIERADTVEVTIDLPGVDPARTTLELTGNVLNVRGEQAAAETQPGDVVHRRERAAGDFCRSISLPVAVNPDEISAESRHGVLTVRLGKDARYRGRSIPITVRPESPG